MTQAKPNYQALNDELEAILDTLQQDGIDIDEAMRKYERGMELIKLLETYLKDAENKVVKLQAKFGDAKS